MAIGQREDFLYFARPWSHSSGGPMMMRQSRCRGPQQRVHGARSRAGGLLSIYVRRNRAPMSDLRTRRRHWVHGRGIRTSVRPHHNPLHPRLGGPGDGLKCPRCPLVTFGQSKVTENAHLPRRASEIEKEKSRNLQSLRVLRPHLPVLKGGSGAVLSPVSGSDRCRGGYIYRSKVH